jgi:hypothetical protein
VRLSPIERKIALQTQALGVLGALGMGLGVSANLSTKLRLAAGGPHTHTASSKYHDEIISLAFIHTKYGEPIVIMVFRCAIQKVLCLTPPGGETEIGGCKGFTGTPGRLLFVTTPHTQVYMGYAECLPTFLTPLAERVSLSQVGEP